ncbi:hypothetical protein [Couchioplanes caeruleus]|uniref:Ricin B lectin domain-containing protein n=2 Tax=Couchioplanes caeruleus TaxID=56438 RepID=A0A1K0GT65_9ACTN|nr:hypothetical protein [Couchioplanes caeruleus]OJF12475.1 hypothetical protein BG844_20410 [Couchioplanes caeruleus subsp. caeruleus]ROP31232.1 hypothetical protein EDD30_4123 [Couchioplanes caeruleus]
MHDTGGMARVCAALLGILLTQQACDARKPAPSPTSSAAASPSPSAQDVFRGDREVLLLPVGSAATLAVGETGWIELTDDFGDRALFVLTKADGDRYRIRTARLRTGGKASCIEVGKAGAVTAAPCDAAKNGQVFRIRRSGTAYTLCTGKDTCLVQSPASGVRAVPLAAGTPGKDALFFVPDRGRASIGM